MGMTTPRPIADRFWPKVDKRSPDECWNWVGQRDHQGYGRLKVGSKPARAHRISWMLSTGESAGSLCVLHSCDNPTCVNPDHLFAGTHSDNMRDREAKGRNHSLRAVWERRRRNGRGQFAKGLSA